MEFIFADHVLDTNRRELRRGAEDIAVEPQVLDLLICLVENRDRVVTKDDLIASVWGGRIVSDATLTSRVHAARKAVGDDGQGQKLIRTISRKGLRFVGDVRTEAPCSRAVVAIDPQPSKEVPLPIGLSHAEGPAIAVLPFTNMCGDPAEDYFSDGISEDIITALSKLRRFLLIARNSSFLYKGKTVPLKQIAEELGVAYVVQGSVRRRGDRVRITAQLSSAFNGSQIWAERYDHHLADVFAVQDEITEAIVAAIEPQIYAAENFRTLRKPPDRLDAWDLLMRATSHYWRLTREDNAIALALLEKAIEIDPVYGQALGLLATTHLFNASMGWADRTIVGPIAERAALAAIRADSDDPWAHHALGCIHLFARRFDDCLADFEHALRLNPNFCLAQGYYGLALAFCGRWKEGEEAAHRALRLSPHDPFSALYYGVASYTQFVGRNYDEAMQLARTAIRLHPDFIGGYRGLTSAAGMSGQAGVAAGALQELRRVQPNISLQWVADQVPIRDDAERAHYVEGFRRAGLD
ncbi:winged helix-turn-helix domain-containing tetratricopeptide repeat protein [Reyranella sp.]|uniref:winged helix-turn-helix domain-containing tetratricopeptide repeat protein n=1 Tax=Reyranella sp. TaxID=1929291 RepID=UPI003D117757